MNGPSVLSRISGWFKPTANGDAAHRLPLEDDQDTLSHTPVDPGPIHVTTYLKPWAKRDNALVQLQEGFNTLNNLVGSVKENLDRQAQRHDELLRLLQHLPEALRAIPENSRTQTETLKVVGEQLTRHNLHYHRLADVLEKVSDSASDQRRTLDALNERVEVISQHDRSMADNMRSVSSAMEGVSQNTQTSAQVLDQLRNDARTRDNEFLRILNRQRVRITAMLGVAILVSVTALAAVCLIGWKMLAH